MGKKVSVVTNPITEEDYANPRSFYIVNVGVGFSQYLYLVPASADGSPPSDEIVDKWINNYVANPVPGGRRIEYYVSAEDINVS